jgi:hypothetical protein
MDTKMETLTGGSTLTAHYTDGTCETVKVRQLPIRLLQSYLQTVDDECARLELLCDKPERWADKLTAESHVDLLTAGEALNNDNFFAWLRRRVQRQERLAPGSSGELGKHLLSASPIG